MAKPNINPPQLTQKDIRRFWSKVDKAPGFGPNGDCWKWTAGRHVYGRFGIRRDGRNRHFTAHRLSYFLSNQKWPCEWVLHKCDNTLCVNPEHLFEGNAKDNTLDAVSKRRMAAGKRHYRTRLHEEDVRQIRNLAASISKKQIAKKFNILVSNVYSIVNRTNWKYLD